MSAAALDLPRRLPVPLTSLVGREREIDELCGLLRRPGVRLLTLTGPGGAGKTRLAIAIAERLLEDLHDAVTFVSLAAISDPALVASAIAETFGIHESAERSIRDGLIAFLASRRLLLVLDNFEQVAPAAPLLGDLLSACPNLAILVTSRATLHLSGERDYLVPPLALPDPERLPPLERLAEVEAIRLFVERAQAARADFALNADRAAAVAAVCRRLDGLPLAIELAASRISVLSPQALLARLEHRLRVLTAGPLDAPARQQTLRDTIAWSHDLLPIEARRLFLRMALFSGGWTLEAAEAVCETDDAPSASSGQTVFEGLATLIDHSLVWQGERPDGSTRFGMLETIREYGIEQLDASGEAGMARRRHLTYFLDLAEQSAPGLHGPRQKYWLDRLDAEHNNLRAALQYSLEHAPAAALRLAGALGWFWFIHGHLTEGVRWSQSALANGDDRGAPERAAASTTAGMLLRELGAYDAAAPYLDDAIANCRERGDTAGLVEALFQRAGVWLYRAEPESMRPLVEEGLRLARVLDDRHGMAMHLSMLAIIDFQPSLTEQCLTLMREVGDMRDVAMALGHIGYTALGSGDYERAGAVLREGLALSRELEDTTTIAFLLAALGCLALEQGDLDLARASFAEYLELERTLQIWGDMSSVVEGFAGVALVAGMPERAARLLGAAETIRELTGEPIHQFLRAQQERTIARVRALMTEADFQKAWSTGRAMSQNDTIDLALEPLPPSPRAMPAAFPNGLTAREVDVLRLVAEGLTDPEVAERLFVSRRTVNTHLTSIYTKLNVSSRSGATRFAVEHGLT